ncbi:MAG: glycosyltransferase [Saprospiraceae bacterium]
MTEKKPLVSIIMPAYNAEYHILDALKSALTQTYSNIEIIVINDGSIDNTANIIRRVPNDKIKIINQPHQGVSAARNTGLREANGEYIQFLDADDLISPEKISSQVSILLNNHNCISFCETRFFLDGKDPIHEHIISWDPWHSQAKKYDPVEFLVRLWGGYGHQNTGMIQTNAWLCPREILNKAGMWREDISVDDDGEYFTRVILNSDGLLFSFQGLNYYRKYPAGEKNLSALKNYKAYESIFKSISSKEEQILRKGKNPFVMCAIAHQYTSFYYSCFPYYPSLMLKARKKIREFGGLAYPYKPGNRVLQKLSPYINWKFLKIISDIKKVSFKIINWCQNPY